MADKPTFLLLLLLLLPLFLLLLLIGPPHCAGYWAVLGHSRVGLGLHLGNKGGGQAEHDDKAIGYTVLAKVVQTDRQLASLQDTASSRLFFFFLALSHCAGYWAVLGHSRVWARAAPWQQGWRTGRV